MILETYKISLNDLKVSCSTTIYKNLSLTMRIQNRQYPIIPSTGYFDGSSSLKSRFIDTIDFEFDTERNKYLPKQIELELKLIYRTGKINQKIYSVNLNEFSTVRKGTKEKALKVIERLYSLQCIISAKSNATDSPFFNEQMSGLERVKSQKRFDRQGSDINHMNKRRQYKSKSPEPVIKYTINENIKITRHQEQAQNESISSKQIKQQHNKSILKESFELQNQSSSSFKERNKVFTSRIKKTIQVNQYPIKGINNALNNGFNQRTKMFALENSVADLTQELKKEKENSYRLQKQIASLKNKLQHVYHEKALLLKQKQDDRLVFQTKDKEQKIRQRRDIEQLRRNYEGQINQKQKQITKLTIELKQTYSASINNLNRANQSQTKLQEMSSFFQKRVAQLDQDLKLKKQQVNIKNQELNNLAKERNQLRKQNQKLGKQIDKLNERIYDLERNKKASKLQDVEYIQTEDIYIKSTEQNYVQPIQTNFMSLPQNQELIQLVDKQTKTYHQMIARLEQNIRKLELQLKQLQRSHVQATNELQIRQAQLNDRDREIIALRNRVRYLEDQLQSERIKVVEMKTLLSESHTTQSSLKEKEKKNNRYRSYSSGSQYTGGETVKIKTTERYRLVYQPQAAIVYVPPMRNSYIQSCQSSNYGKDFAKYQQSTDSQNFPSSYQINSPYLKYLDGYFGTPLSMQILQNMDKKTKESAQNQGLNSSKQHSIGKEQKSLDQFSRRSVYLNSSMHNEYLSPDNIAEKNKDEYIIQNSSNSYIDENGNYVKENRKTVYKKE